MKIRGLIIWIVLNIYCSKSSAENHGYYDQGVYATSKENLRSTNNPYEVPQTPDVDSCSSEDLICLAATHSDRLGLEAIQILHKQIDDDQDGTIDLSESDDFLKELKIDAGKEKRQKNFHKNDDMHISVKELLEAWLRSEVHNWTLDQTSDWLTNCVQLPQYVPNFIQNGVNGAKLPRLAVDDGKYLTILGIKDPIHKRKIALKAMDVVLFGPPKDLTGWKDLTLIFLTIVGGLGGWYAYQQNKKFKRHLNRMTKDMDSLQNAEKALENLQKELEHAKQAQESVITEKQNLEKKLQDSKSELNTLPYSDLEVSQLKAEIEMLRTELQLAEGELKDRCWMPPHELQQWLQLTYETENKAYMKKKISAEKQLQQAREACEKLRKKRSSLVGAFVSTHGKSIDEVDRSIVEARTSLQEVTQELQERAHRWKQIEMLCGFSIINNNGYAYLENALYRGGNGRGGLIRGRMSSTDDLDDETSSMYGGSLPGYIESCQMASHWKDGDSSSSETSKQEEEGGSEPKVSSKNNVHFSVGSDVSPWSEDTLSSTTQTQPKNVVGRLSSNPKSVSQSNISLNLPAKPTSMTRSFSQDINVSPADTKPKSSLSDTNLEVSKIKPLKQIKEQPSVSIEDDVCSTDSSVLDESDSKKKKRSKLFSFNKKGKNKGD
ncbi:unnamed protein product [Acanthoscelides obtectus]|uniref:SAM domain-containing protein n=1 Tax=Acanthoscelides obtectus TaxID=200917 RepID=A0A9P0LM51_ACAOB|nr:unnamed protein product [Acanthoscelides obtectus]CAK1632951.1 Stromal interaction molecule homolog [Acanthoscelides obtectus]